MKTAEEWEKAWCDDYNKHEQIAQIRIIQLDAWKQGMSDAARIANPTNSQWYATKTIETNILTARDNKTTL